MSVVAITLFPDENSMHVPRRFLVEPSRRTKRSKMFLSARLQRRFHAERAQAAIDAMVAADAGPQRLVAPS